MNAQVEEIISELNYALALPFVTIEQKSIVRDEINRIHKKAFASLKQPAQEPVIIAIAQNEPPRVMLQDRVNGKYMCFDVDSFVQAHLATEQINGFFNAITHPAPLQNKSANSWQELDEYPSKQEILKTISDAVYAQYPKKEWQGLSDNEIFNLSQQCDLNHILGLIDYGRAIEQALKEKNT